MMVSIFISTTPRSPRRGLPIGAIALAAAAALALGSCSSPADSSAEASTGSVSIEASFDAASASRIGRASGSSLHGPALTCFPVGVDLSSVAYTLTLTNASSDSPIDGGSSSTGSFATLTGVPVGTWTATVVAVDAGVPIGTGSATLFVSAESTASATVNLAPPSSGAGTLSVGAHWSFSARPLVVITPISPTGGSPATDAPASDGTSYANAFSLPGGEYLIEFSIRTGPALTTQATVRESAYVLPGRTTNFSYEGDPTAWKSGPPVAPSVAVVTGYSATSGSYAYVSWSGALGATSYDLERATASSAAGLDGASYTTIASSLAASAFGYNDAGLTNTSFYRYRVTAANGSGSTQAAGDAPMSALTVATSISGTSVSGSGSYLMNTPVSINILYAMDMAWTYAEGTAYIPSIHIHTWGTTAILLAPNVTITAVEYVP